MEDFEDAEFVATEHDRLVSAISKLDKTQHITEPTRNEPTNLNTEFNLIKRDQKLNINNVVKLLEDTSRLVKVSKKLKNAQNKAAVLPKPLEKPQAERIKRSTGYDETKKRVGRWDAVVARSRTVNYMSFPLRHSASKLEPSQEFISKFELKSSLEKELEEVDPPPTREVEAEEEQVYPMSYEEMIEHRQQTAKLRAQQSYKAAKAKRQGKIKSKKYHRILKKERLKQQLKEFEELQKKDPEEALKKLEALEKARALERHTLRHKNTGKWAKSKLVRAKYDKEVRQELAEQLAVSRGLTHKAKNEESSDDDANDNETIGIPDINLTQDPMNPWMLKKNDKSIIDEEFNFGYKKYLNNRKRKTESDSDSNSDIETNDNNADDTSLENNIFKKTSDIPSKVSDINVPTTPVILKSKKSLGNKKAKLLKTKKTIATSDWLVEDVNNKEENEVESANETISEAFESFESKVAAQVEQKLKQIRANIEKLEKSKQPLQQKNKKLRKKKEKDNLEYLKLKTQKVKPIIDEPLIETSSIDLNTDPVKQDKNNAIAKVLPKGLEVPTQSTDSDIDPSRFIEVKPKYLNTALPDGVNELDQLDDDEQVVPKVNIEDVFEEDDVVASFRQEKEDEVNKGKEMDVEISLPGWGNWGGKGVKAPKRKRNRFIQKPAPIVPRRDDNKGDIIIKEYRDPKLALHKVTNVPFPFNSVKDYEASIRAPIGNTFIPEKAHKILIRPSIITKSGTIIEPMDEEELLQKKNKSFKNENVIGLLAKQ